MVSEPPKVARDGHYNVKHTAAALGISTKTVKRHTDANYIKCHYHKYSGQPFYLGADILRYWGAEY